MCNPSPRSARHTDRPGRRPCPGDWDEMLLRAKWPGRHESVPSHGLCLYPSGYSFSGHWSRAVDTVTGCRSRRNLWSPALGNYLATQERVDWGDLAGGGRRGRVDLQHLSAGATGECAVCTGEAPPNCGPMLSHRAQDPWPHRQVNTLHTRIRRWHSVLAGAAGHGDGD